MENRQEHIYSLIQRYRNGTASEDEVRELLHLIRSKEDEDDMDYLLTEGLLDDIPEAMKTSPRMKKKMEDIFVLIERRKAPQKPKAQMIRWLPYVAAILLFLSIGIYWHGSTLEISQPATTSHYGNDVLPGGNRAIITLSDGTVVLLDEERDQLVANGDVLNYADGEQLLSAPAEVEYATLSTPKGGQYRLTLSDGSKVWVNAASSLTYPVEFTDGQRHVKLEGEAYFEIAKDETTPFIVESNEQKITVTGTAFNVEAYGDQQTTNTTLVSGSVVINSNNGHGVTLRPGQRTILEGDGFKTGKADIHAVTGWVRGEFIFHYSTLTDILPQLERWYNIEVDIPAIPHEEFYAEMSRNMPLSAVLKAMEQTSNLRFEIKERRLLLKKR